MRLLFVSFYIYFCYFLRFILCVRAKSVHAFLFHTLSGENIIHKRVYIVCGYQQLFAFRLCTLFVLLN